MRILALDPGSDKCGIAIVNGDGSHGELVVVYLTEVHRVVRRMVNEHHPELIVLGGGTAARPVLELINHLDLGIDVRFGDERNSTREARTRYFGEHPPTGIWRWVPLGLQAPDRPVDDYAAWVIGERYLREHQLLSDPEPGTHPT